MYPGDAPVVTLRDASAKDYRCQLLDIFEWRDQQYAILVPLDREAVVVMRVVRRDGQSVFQPIEDDYEFEAVVTHIQELGPLSEHGEDE